MRMEELITLLINLIFTNFDFGYMISVNILTYVCIKVLDVLNKDKIVTTILKRIILVISILILSSVYIMCNYEPKLALINSSIACPVIWTWLLKPICKKLRIDYRDISNTIE